MKLLLLSLTLVLGEAGALGVHSSQAPVAAIKTHLAVYKTALDAFRSDCGRYPSTSEGLYALVVCPTNIPAGLWRGPYYEDRFKDLWKHDYVYRCPGIHNTNGFDLYSCGVDGISKTGGSDLDDINSWDPASPHGGDYMSHDFYLSDYFLMVPGWLWGIIAVLLCALALRRLAREPKAEA
jgi:general secretion pathway protein G